MAMSSEPHRPLRLSPEHFAALALFQDRRVVGARVCRAGGFDEDGFVLYGRLEVLANCGLVELITREGRRDAPPGDVTLYYYLTDRGGDLLRWRTGRPGPARGRRTRQTLDPANGFRPVAEQ
jgi:hypothetical protein